MRTATGASLEDLIDVERASGFQRKGRPPMNAMTTPRRRDPTTFHNWHCDGWTVLSVSGELDDPAVCELERQFTSAVTGGIRIAVDLTHATVVGNSRVPLDDVLTGMDRLLRAFGGRLAVLGRD